MATVDQYTARITSEHRGQPDFTAAVADSVQPFVDEINVTVTFPSLYDLDTAVGVQLDATGLWIGESRFLETPLTGVYFTWGDASVGWGLGYWKGPFDPTEGVVRLDDETYRLVLRVKILVNNWDGTVPTALAALNTLFSAVSPGTGIVIQDGLDMSMTFALVGVEPPIIYQQLFVSGKLGGELRPCGVLANYVIVSVSDTPAFGWGLETPLIAGWGEGSWVRPIV